MSGGSSNDDSATGITSKANLFHLYDTSGTAPTLTPVQSIPDRQDRYKFYMKDRVTKHTPDTKKVAVTIEFELPEEDLKAVLGDRSKALIVDMHSDTVKVIPRPWSCPLCSTQISGLLESCVECGVLRYDVFS